MSTDRRKSEEGQGAGRRGDRRKETSADTSTTPMTLRPTVSAKDLAEALARQLEQRRSKLDPDIYELGTLLLGVARVSQDQQIGTYSRKAAARKLRPFLQPLFELLLQEGEMPVLFSLLLGSASARAGSGQAEAGFQQGTLLPDQAAAQRTYEVFSTQAAEQALQGFPEEL